MQLLLVDNYDSEPLNKTLLFKQVLPWRCPKYICITRGKHIGHRNYLHAIFSSHVYQSKHVVYKSKTLDVDLITTNRDSNISLEAHVNLVIYHDKTSDTFIIIANWERVIRIEDFYTRGMHGYEITSHSIVWSVITYTCLRYMASAPGSKVLNWSSVFQNIRLN